MKGNTMRSSAVSGRGLRNLTYWQKREVIRFLWFVIAAAFLVQLMLLEVGEKSFY